MKLTAWVTIASLLMYVWVFLEVAKARRKHGVHAPLTDGPQAFLCAMRVQTNTVEQMVIFLPLLWLSCLYSGDMITAIAGAVWVVGRIIYALGYYKAPEKRHTGFLIATVATVGLLISAMAGLVLHQTSFETVASSRKLALDGAQEPECISVIHEDSGHRPMPNHGCAVGFKRGLLKI